jgi:hypothetical protein
MNMNSKITVYMVVAVALGYLLVSTVPNTLMPPRMEELRSPTEDEQILGAKPKMEIQGSETKLLGQPTIWDSVSQIGFWLVDLLIAFGVYFIARRKVV